MSNSELLLGGIQLMVFGMGMVFAFLVVMIFAMVLLEKALKPFAGMLEPAPKPAAKPKAAASQDDVQLAAIAATAVEMMRK